MVSFISEHAQLVKKKKTSKQALHMLMEKQPYGWKAPSKQVMLCAVFTASLENAFQNGIDIY